MSKMGPRFWRRVRQAVQIACFVLFSYLLFAALPRRAAFLLADLFFRLDPLSALGSLLGGHDWPRRLALALLTIGLTLVLGRVWCGWICPLGSLLEWLRFPRPRGGPTTVSPRCGSPPSASSGQALSSQGGRSAKYLILAAALMGALFGSLTLLVLDPLALLTRTMTAVVLPALNYAVTAAVSALYPIALLQGALDGVERLLRGPVLPVKQPLFSGSLLIALVFAAVIALNRLADRFWCRYLCPLGALLALFARVSLLRPFIGDACTHCGHCATVCRMDAIDSQDAYRISPTECTVCLDCLADCPHAEVGFRLTLRLPGGWPAPAGPHDPRRRQVLAALAAGAAGVAVMRTGVRAQRPDPQLIRPPGAQDEAGFLSRCLRCSQCMRVCPTAGLQPALGEGGLEGLWTPHLVSRLGYCSYGCNACGQVCPSHAIPAMDLAAKRRAVLGVAAIDRNRCLPWVQGTPCIVCEEMCPLSPKAIRLEEVAVADAHDQAVAPLRKQGTTAVQRPHVLPDRCIGCGICEYQCPISGAAAIQVYRA